MKPSPVLEIRIETCVAIAHECSQSHDLHDHFVTLELRQPAIESAHGCIPLLARHVREGVLVPTR